MMNSWKKLPCRRCSSGPVKDVAHETARSFIQAWSQHKAGLPIDDLSRRKIDEQLRLVPLLKEYLAVQKRKRKE